MHNLEHLPPDTVRRLNDYVLSSAHISSGRHDWRIPAIVAEQWTMFGAATISTNELARRFGTTRRTVCLAIARLLHANIIEVAGQTEDGRPVYAPCLARGDEWRDSCAERSHGEE